MLLVLMHYTKYTVCSTMQPFCTMGVRLPQAVQVPLFASSTSIYQSLCMCKCKQINQIKSIMVHCTTFWRKGLCARGMGGGAECCSEPDKPDFVSPLLTAEALQSTAIRSLVCYRASLVHG